MKIAIDLMGGEGCGEQNLEGCLSYPYTEELIVIGDIVRLDQQKINVFVERGAHLRPCAAALSGYETPRALLKRSHDTSLAIGMQMLADKKADALVSSADTKAMMALGRGFLGTVAVLYRPAIAKAFQGPWGQFYMLDLGANVHCTALVRAKRAAKASGDSFKRGLSSTFGETWVNTRPRERNA